MTGGAAADVPKVGLRSVQGDDDKAALMRALAAELFPDDKAAQKYKPVAMKEPAQSKPEGPAPKPAEPAPVPKPAPPKPKAVDPNGPPEPLPQAYIDTPPAGWLPVNPLIGGRAGIHGKSGCGDRKEEKEGERFHCHGNHEAGLASLSIEPHSTTGVPHREGSDPGR